MCASFRLCFYHLSIIYEVKCVLIRGYVEIPIVYTRYSIVVCCTPPLQICCLSGSVEQTAAPS